MKNTTLVIINILIATLFTMMSCNNNNTKSESNMENKAKKDNQAMGAIYVATNKPDNNTIVAYHQMTDGSLKAIGEFPSGGKGTGDVEIFEGSKNDPTHPLADGVDPLISAYGVFKTNDDKHILVVNAGSASVTSFNVNADHSLTLANTVKAGDKYPLSIAAHKDVVYVASSGTATTPPFSGNITGYKISSNGTLSPIEGSTRDLGARPSCIAYTDDGNFLIVNELVTGMVKVFKANADGSISKEPISKIASPHDSDKGRWLAIPVGFDVLSVADGYAIFVSEARFLDNKGMLRAEKDKVPQAPLYSWQTGSTSSYLLGKDGVIKLVSGDVLTGTAYEGGQIANCWVEVSKSGRTLYAANALSSSISTYDIKQTGAIVLRNEQTYKDASEGLFFSDLYLSKDGKYLNQLIGNKGQVLVFKVLENDKLERIGMYGNMPDIGCYGLVTL